MSFSRMIRDVFIFLCTYTGVVSLYSFFLKRSRPLVRVVVFHDIENKEWFNELIEAFVRSYHILTPEDFFEEKYDKEKINVLFTFDDGYGSWISHVGPVLKRHGIRGLFFINSGLLDIAHEPEKVLKSMRDEYMIRPRAPLTWEGAKLLCMDGHAVGSHAYRHVNLARCREEEVNTLLEQDRKRINEKLGVVVTDVAYPFGTRAHVNRMVQSQAEKVGFKRGYTAWGRFVRGDETFAIPRMCIEDTMTPKRLRFWMDGGYDLFDMLKQLCAR